MPSNLLYYGDNLDVLRGHVGSESVDLVYLDPPFNSKATYNVLFGEQDGTRAASQIIAFEDTWRWDAAAAEAFQDSIEAGGPASLALQALRTLLGTSNMLAYLAMMAPRLAELRRVLKPTGSIYLHCDPTASHYLKVLMDAIFGPQRFVSEIIWKRTNIHSDAKRWSPVSDTILFYSKGDRFIWHPQHAPHDEQYVATKYRYDDGDGRGPYRLDNMTSPHPRPNMTYEWRSFPPPPNGWRYSRETMGRLHAEGRIWYPDSTTKRPQLKRYLREMPGTLLGNIWTDILPINSQAQERLGYPTQKPEALLERIIRASSNEGDTVLDPFCGCGTAVVVSQRLGRRWIGIDITHLAIALIKNRLRDTFGDSAAYQVIGEPVSVPDARALAEQDPYQFQWWALSLVGAAPIEQKKGSDRGIDGWLYFHDERGGGETKQVVLSVKAGHTNVAHLRDLRGVMQRESAEIGVLITMQEPTQPMRAEATGAGFYHSPLWNRNYPALQILTVADLLEGKGIDMPPIRQTSTTFRKAARQKGESGVQLPLTEANDE